MADSPGSPLSSIASEDLSDRDDSKQTLLSPMPPSKKRRTGNNTNNDCNTPVSTTAASAANYPDDIQPPASPATTISSDSSGEVPNSPTTLALLNSGGSGSQQRGGEEEDYSGYANDQVTVCRWEGCEAGDLGDMDGLVSHIQAEHIGSRQKKYACEWADCNRKGQTHASGYALRAHMRSHTREKPFYCSLPECDRSFTRSDALTKHMRTVHETEALRPFEPLKAQGLPLPIVGGGSNATGTPASKLQRIKLKISQPKDEADQHSESAPEDNALTHEATTIDEQALDGIDVPEYSLETGFDDHELSLPPRDLYRVLRRQIHWAQQGTEALRAEYEHTLRPKRKQCWLEKEAIFDDLIEAEVRFFQTIMREQEVAKATAAANPNAAAEPEAETGDADADADADALERERYQQQQMHEQKLQELEFERKVRALQEVSRASQDRANVDVEASTSGGAGGAHKPSSGFVIPRPAGDI